MVSAKIVCVRNKRNKKDWIAFICTNPGLSEEEIIRIYGKRWQIEVFFKTCKSNLQLIGECHSLSYDALTAHVAIVFARYLMIALEQRRNEDDRSLGEIFYFFTDELADITFAESFRIILEAFMDSIHAVFKERIPFQVWEVLVINNGFSKLFSSSVTENPSIASEL